MHPSSWSHPSRRQFLATLAAAGAALPLGSVVAQAQTPPGRATPPGPSSPPSRTRSASVLHVFAKPLQWLSYDGTAALAAEAGLGGIDYAVRPAGHVLPEKVQEDLPRAIEAAHKAGLKVEMITTAIVSAREPHTETLLRTAAKHGVKIYRLGNFNFDPKLHVMASLEKLKPAVKELVALNQSLGLQGAFQNHAGTRVGSALWDLYELLRDVDPRGMGVQYDIRHATAEGGQSWPLPLRLLAPWIRCTDIKDFKWQQSPGRAVIENVPLGEGVVNFDQYFKLVSELKISGPISMHFEYPPFERGPKLTEVQKRIALLAAMKKDVAFLKGHLAKQKLG